jgi:septum formation protein
MRDYSQKEVDHYLLCNESLDKTGGYSIQGEGRTLIESIRGDYLAAVGLPLKPVADYLRSRGVQGLTNVDKLYADKSFLNWQSFEQQHFPLCGRNSRARALSFASLT